MEGTFRRANRLRSSGYPSNLLVIVAEDFINEFRNTSDNLTKKNKAKQKATVIPYQHQTSRNLMEVGGKY